jgi:phage FluMu protein Com
MVVYSCKNCGELNYLTPHAFWNIADFGAKCEKCETINTITLEKGELVRQESEPGLMDIMNRSSMRRG